MSNHDIEGRVPPETAPDAANPQSGAPDSLERQLAKEREARQQIRDRLRHTEALAAESHALRSRMAEELERVTADRDRLRAEASIAAAVAVPDPAAASSAAATPAGREPAPSAAASASPARPRAASPDLREPPGFDGSATMPGVPGGARAAAGAARPARSAEPTLASTPPAPRGRDENPLGERPLKPPVRRGPWRALAMLGGLAAAVAGLAWLTGTMPSGLELASSKPSSSASASDTGAAPAASAPALAMDSQPEMPASPATSAAAAASTTLATTTTLPPNGAVPLPPVSPEAQLAAAPTAAGPVATAAVVPTGPASVPPPVATPLPAPAPASLQAHGQSQIQAEGGLDMRLRKALDGEGIASIVEIDPVNGHVRVADPQADRTLRERTDMLIRAVYAGASLPEPQIEHRWMSPMHGERAQQQAQAAPVAPAKGLTRPTTRLHGTPPPTLSQAQPQAPGGSQHDLTNAKTPGLAAVERVNLAPPGAGGPTRHVESGRPELAVTGMEELRPVVPAGRVTASCMEGLAGKTSNRRAALTSCMKRSCCGSSTNLNSDECRAYQKAYPYACGAG